jgi:hypothetical protein
MTIKAALDGVETALALITKGDADAQTKLDALRPLLYELRANIMDVSQQEYENYMDAETAPPASDVEALTFDDDDEIQEKFYTNFKSQQFNNLRSYYDIEAFREIDNAQIRVCMARALCKLAAENDVSPNKSWQSVISAEGKI